MYRLIIIMYGIYPSEPMPFTYSSLESCQSSVETFMENETVEQRVRDGEWTIECADRLRYLELKYSQ